MIARLIPLAAIACLLLACSDVEDEPKTPVPTPTPSVAAVAPSSTPEPPSPSATAAIVVATVTPTREPRPVGTPDGTTGIRGGNTPGLTYDDDCLAGDSEDLALPPATTVAVTPTEGEQVPTPYVPIEPAQDLALKQTLDATLGDRATTYAYYVKDLSTGRTAAHNHNAVFNAASLFKLFVMYEVFRQEHLGQIAWDDQLIVTRYYDAFALSPRVTELCQVITVAEAMDAMLSVSDNAAAVLLQDLVGSGNVNASIAALGLRDSGLLEDGLPVTATDLALLMEAIATGSAIGPEASADMLKLLDHDVFENGLVSGVPQGTVVARKTGNWADATHVAGIVYAPSGPYVFVALTTNGYETEIIRALSSATFAHFDLTSD